MTEADDACRSCGAPILWVDVNGKPTPFDARPTQAAIPPKHEIYEGGDLDVERVHVSHFVTCPDAEDWSGSSRTEQREITEEGDGEDGG